MAKITKLAVHQESNINNRHGIKIVIVRIPNEIGPCYQSYVEGIGVLNPERTYAKAKAAIVRTLAGNLDSVAFHWNRKNQHHQLKGDTMADTKKQPVELNGIFLTVEADRLVLIYRHRTTGDRGDSCPWELRLEVQNKHEFAFAVNEIASACGVPDGEEYRATFRCSSSVDFPDEHTDNAKVVQLCHEIQESDTVTDLLVDALQSN